ncbi:MAG TPA: condensation domain-containing protein [Hyphomonadaceae bacterium]|jgi:hypothetical protein|nr:condensation domain-containing protein [Hyphomonadaceae bacterium]
MDTRTRLPKLETGSRIRPSEAPVSMAQLPWLDPDNLPIHEQWLPVVWRMEGPLDVRAFLGSFQELTRRHDVLRARYAPSGKTWVQSSSAVEDVLLRPLDMSDADARVRELLIWQRLKTIYDAPVSLDGGTVRLELFKTGTDRYLLAGFLHHIVTDNVSIGIFFRELMLGYMRRVSGADPLPPPKLQYSDFALWESSWLKGGGREEAARYWKKALARARPFHLPDGKGRRAPVGAWAGQSFEIPSDIVLAARQHAFGARATLAIQFQAALCLALAKWAKQDQVLLGSFTQGRPAGFGGVMGCFMQLRPLFVDLGGAPRLTTVLERTREAAIAVADFRKPIEAEVLERLGVGSVILNYVRRSRRSGDDAQSATIERPAEGARPEVSANWSEGAAVSVPSGDIGPAAASTEAWATTDALSATMSLGSPGRERALRGLRVGMSRLPRQLQSQFSRDLHIGVLESDDRLDIQTTVSDKGIDPARVAEMMTDIVSFLPLLATQGNRKAADLIG